MVAGRPQATIVQVGITLGGVRVAMTEDAGDLVQAGDADEVGSMRMAKVV